MVREVEPGEARQGHRQDREAARARGREGQGWSRPTRTRSAAASTPTLDYADLADCDLVIEAITEDLELQARDVAGGRRDRQGRGAASPPTPRRSPSIDQAAATDAPRALPRPALLQPGAGDAAARGRAARSRPSDEALEARLRVRREARQEDRRTRRTRPGFIVNRLLVPYLLDAIRAYEEGVGSIEEIDAAMKARRQPPDGPARRCSTSSGSTRPLDRRGHVRRVPRAALRAAADAAQAGRRRAGTAASPGAGFYDYSGDEPVPMDRRTRRLTREQTDAPDTRASRRGARARRSRAARSATARRPPSRASCRSASGSRGWSTPSRSPRRRCSPTGTQEGLGADGVVTGHGAGRRPAGRADGQRPDRQGRLVGPEDGREDPPHPGAGAAARACRWSTSSTRRARGSPTRCRCSPAAAAPGRIFYNEVRLSGRVPQVCVLFGPSAAGGAYIPAFCDVVIMREGNASMYLGSPRMAEMVIGEKVTLEEMGGAQMHTVGLRLRPLPGRDRRGGDRPRPALPLLHARRTGARRRRPRRRPSPAPSAPISRDRPGRRERRRSTSSDLIDALVDAGSFLEVHARWAKELVVGYARLDGRVVGIVANQPKVKGGVLFVDSADKAARFIWTCNAFNVPLLFLADVPGLHDRHGGRAPGDHPPRREDDQRRLRGDGAEDLGDRAQGLRRRALRDGRPGVRARLLPRAARRPRSP